jgi:hypothetical protein
MEAITKFKNLVKIDIEFLEDILNLPEIKSLLDELNILGRLDKTAQIFGLYLSREMRFNTITGRFHLAVRIPKGRNINLIVRDIKYPFHPIDYSLLIKLAVITVLYDVSLANNSISDDIISKINVELIDVVDNVRLFIDKLLKINATYLITPIVATNKVLNEYISKIDLINLDNLLPSQLLEKIKKLAEERIEIKFRPGGIGARDAEDEFDRRNGKLTKECDISYLELENKAKSVLAQRNLVNICQAITQFATLIELEGPCDQYSIEDLKDIIKQLIKILSKSNLCLLIKILSNKN